MKTIKNKKAKWESQGAKFNTDYFGMLKTAIENVPKDGLNVSQMGERLNLLDKLSKAKDELELENAEFKLVYNMMQTQRWTVITQEIADFYAILEKLKAS